MSDTSLLKIQCPSSRRDTSKTIHTPQGEMEQQDTAVATTSSKCDAKGKHKCLVCKNLSDVCKKSDF